MHDKIVFFLSNASLIDMLFKNQTGFLRVKLLHQRGQSLYKIKEDASALTDQSFGTKTVKKEKGRLKKDTWLPCKDHSAKNGRRLSPQPKHTMSGKFLLKAVAGSYSTCSDLSSKELQYIFLSSSIRFHGL